MLSSMNHQDIQLITPPHLSELAPSAKSGETINTVGATPPEAAEPQHNHGAADAILIAAAIAGLAFVGASFGSRHGHETPEKDAAQERAINYASRGRAKLDHAAERQAARDAARSASNGNSKTA